MTASQENRMSMYYAVRKVLEKHNAIWSGTVAFAAAVTELLTNITTLEGVVSRQVIDIRGFAKDKANTLDSMIEATLKVAGGTLAYATVMENPILATQMSVSRSSLNRHRDAIVGQVCQAIHDAANAEIANLGDYGIVAGDMTALQDAIDAYTVLVSAPRNAIAQRKGYTTELAMLIKDTSKVLDNRLDPLMVLFAESAAEFHREYFDARIIVDHRGSVNSEEEGDIAEAA